MQPGMHRSAGSRSQVTHDLIQHAKVYPAHTCGLAHAGPRWSGAALASDIRAIIRSDTRPRSVGRCAACV